MGDQILELKQKCSQKKKKAFNLMIDNNQVMT